MGDGIRVVLAEDSPTVRHHLMTLIDATPDMMVIGEARNGLEAIKMVEHLRPDVVSMDIKMPELDGLEATRRIMELAPTPIVVVSGLLEDDVRLSLQAIEAGALAVVGKPPATHHPTYADKEDKLLKILRAMAGVKVISRRKARNIESDAGDIKISAPSTHKTQSPQIIVIGASTGGPSALLYLLRELASESMIPIVIVQHMPDDFITGLAQWLSNATGRHVFVATHDMALHHGMIVLAPGNTNLTIRRKDQWIITQLDSEKTDSRYVPSIDVLFTSVAETLASRSVGVILTGMGDDGAAGLKKMRDAGAPALVQDEHSSVVFGMPRAAIDSGAATEVVSLANLASRIKKLL